MDKPMVIIRWNDAQDHMEPWVHEDDAQQFGEEACEITSVGFLVRKTEKYATIAGDWNESNKDWGRVTKIPVGMIIEIKEILPPYGYVDT